MGQGIFPGVATVKSRGLAGSQSRKTSGVKGVNALTNRRADVASPATVKRSG